jgi:hypothetical protein
MTSTELLPSISKLTESAPAPGDETSVDVLIGAPPAAERDSLVIDSVNDSHEPYGADFLGGVFVGQDSGFLTSDAPVAHTNYFNGKLLTAHDLTRDQATSSFDTGFDLI